MNYSYMCCIYSLEFAFIIVYYHLLDILILQSLYKKMTNYINNGILMVCTLLFLLQSYKEISLFTSRNKFTTNSIIPLEEAHATLIFCRNPPVLNFTYNISNLKNLIIQPVSSKVEMIKIITLYNGVCLAVESDMAKTVEEFYLYYDWGKR